MTSLNPPRPPLIPPRRVWLWLAAAVLLLLAAILLQASPTRVTATPPEARVGNTPVGLATVVGACIASWHECAVPGDTTVCVLAQTCANYTKTEVDCPELCGKPNICYRCDLILPTTTP